MQRVTVYCASSRRMTHPDYVEAATRLGHLIAEAGLTTVYGGGAMERR